MTVFEWATRHGVSQEAVRELLAVLNPVPSPTVSSDQASEAAVQSSLQIEAARRGGALWRNNSGACMDQDGRMVRYGLANTSAKINRRFKSSDLIGVMPREMPDGSVVGIFTAIEVKSPGWRAPKNERERAQSAFLGKVRALGGVGQFAQSVGDVFP